MVARSTLSMRAAGTRERRSDRENVSAAGEQATVSRTLLRGAAASASEGVLLSDRLRGPPALEGAPAARLYHGSNGFGCLVSDAARF